VTPRDLIVRPLRLWWRLTVIEAMGFVALGRGLARRPHIPPGARPLRYARGRWAAPALFGFAALAELIAIDLLVPWERFESYAGTRWIVFLLGVYGVLWVVFYVVAQHMYPHLLHADELELRNGHFAVARVPRDAVIGARPRPMREDESDRVVLSDPLAPANLDLDFDRQIAIRGMLGGVKRRTSKLAIIVDDPREAADLLATWADPGRSRAG